MRLTSGIYKVTVSTGGSGYAAAPAVQISGGGGTGASAVAQLAGTAVDAVVITNEGVGYTSEPTISITGGSGSGAAATASVLSYGTTAPVSMFRGRFGGLYGVNGYERGFRWLGGTYPLQPLGISPPHTPPTISVTTGNTGQTIRSVAIVNGGAGYFSAPTVSFSGGGVTDGSTLHASARAKIAGARVVGMTIDDRGNSYTSAPQITFSGGLASGATLTVVPDGQLAAVNVPALGTGYTLPPTCIIGGGVASITLTSGGTNYGTVAPTISFATVNGGSAQATCSVSGGVVNAITITSMWAGYDAPPAITFNHATGSGAAATCSLDGLVGAQVRVLVDSSSGRLSTPVISSGGSGATTTPGVALVSATTVAATTGGSTVLTVGSGGTLSPVMAYGVKSITVESGGTGYVSPPAIGFRPSGGGAAAWATVESGAITSVEVLSEGLYPEPPTVVLESVTARAIPVVSSPIVGRYKCAIRYVDSTPQANNGPLASSISDLVDVEAESGVSLEWTWSNDRMESRVDALELWRTTSDQALVLYRVATITKVDGVMPTSYTDTLSDDDLLDSTRTDFALMPIVMPNGRLNARRFAPPVEYASVACMFQDRAWYAVDTRGIRPNSLWHSEIDEPESAPEAYEIVLQENQSDPDAIVTIVPFGSALIVLQSRHLYRLQYVAQPLIDASITLTAYRGIINSRCCDVYDGVLFCADSYGMYAYDGSSVDSFSAPVDDFWRDGSIDFSKSKTFHVAVSPAERVVRFFYCTAEDGEYPVRSLCYCLSTRAWWSEEYASPITSSASTAISLKRRHIFGTAGGFLKQEKAALDSGATAIDYEVRFGNYPVDAGPSREVSVLYRPTDGNLNLALRYNGSTAARPNAVASSRGDGWTSAQGATVAVLDMRSDRSPLGDAPGEATARYFGRADDRSAGADRHLAVGLSGSKATTSSEPCIHALTIQGVG